MNKTWWNVLYENKEKIAAIIKMYYRQGGIDDFEIAIAATGTSRLISIMNDAWFNAPDNKLVYQIPGFSAMCSLLDGTHEDGPDSDS